jgi:hypothetical protein
MPSFHLQEHPHALAHRRAPHHLLVERLVASPVDLYLHPPSNLLVIHLGYSPLRYLSGYSLYSASATSLDAHVSLGSGARVRP